MTYQVQNYDHLLGTPGFSDGLLKNHFSLYKGYVNNVNTMVAEFTHMLRENRMGTRAYADMKRRFGWEFNGMRLHELYFGGMAKNPAERDDDSLLARQMASDFGSAEEWEKAFRAMGAMRGVGWVYTVFDPVGDSLYNVWVNEHDSNVLAGTFPVLIMDVWEHAFMLDYGVQREGYINAYFKAIDWNVAERRFQDARRGEPAVR